VLRVTIDKPRHVEPCGTQVRLKTQSARTVALRLGAVQQRCAIAFALRLGCRYSRESRRTTCPGSSTTCPSVRATCTQPTSIIINPRADLFRRGWWAWGSQSWSAWRTVNHTDRRRIQPKPRRRAWSLHHVPRLVPRIRTQRRGPVDMGRPMPGAADSAARANAHDLIVPIQPFSRPARAGLSNAAGPGSSPGLEPPLLPVSQQACRARTSSVSRCGHRGLGGGPQRCQRHRDVPHGQSAPGRGRRGSKPP